MQKSTSNITNHSTPKQKRLSLGVYCPPKELFNHTARNNYHSAADSGFSGQLTIQNLTSRKSNIPNSIYGISPFAAQTPVASISTEVVSFNRKLTRGYSKFLEEKGFISRRDQERQKVQDDVRRSMTSDNPKVISNEIQKLITSTIVNESIKRPRAALRSTDSNINYGEVNKYDEKHKQICNRILGGSFENNFLFMKMHKENVLSPIVSDEKKYPKKPNSVNKALSFSGSNKLNDYSVSSRTEPKIKKSASGLLPQSLTDLGRDRPEKSQERKCLVDDIENKVPSLTIIGPESVKGSEEVDSLNDLQFQTAIFSQTQLGELKPEIDKTKSVISSSSARSRKFFSDVNTNSQRGDSRTQLEATLKKSPDNIFQTNLHQNIKNKKEFKKSGRRYQSFTEENIEPQTKVVPKLNSIQGGFNKINELCEGAIQSTSRLGHKLRQQHLKTGKDFVNLDILMEKLNYGNTVENWEKSLKQVDNMEAKKILCPDNQLVHHQVYKKMETFTLIDPEVLSLNVYVSFYD